MLACETSENIKGKHLLHMWFKMAPTPLTAGSRTMRQLRRHPHGGIIPNNPWLSFAQRKCVRRVFLASTLISHRNSQTRVVTIIKSRVLNILYTHEVIAQVDSQTLILTVKQDRLTQIPISGTSLKPGWYGVTWSHNTFIWHARPPNK